MHSPALIMKLLVVGLDGADFNLCEKFAEVMPHLAKMRAEGVFTRLESLDLPSTPPCWFSAITGATPEEHRIQGFRKRAMQDVQRKPFWKFLDCPIGVVNVPLVYAHGEHNGFIVPGFHAPWRPFPVNLKMIDSYRVEAGRVTEGRLTWLSEKQSLTAKQVKRRQISFMRLQEEVEGKRIDAIEDLLARFVVDVLFVGIMMLDRIGHAFAHHHWTMLDVYKYVDCLLGRLIAIAEPESVIVFSDHGMDARDSPRIPPGVIENERKRLAKSDGKVRPRGLHTRDGIFAAMGKYVQLGADAKNAELRDIAPTVLAIMGEYKPNTMSGKVLDIFPVDEDPRTVELLRGLGYL